MIDLINGIIYATRFNCESSSDKNSFHDKYVPNYIRLDTFYYTKPGIKIGEFTADAASISFNKENNIDIVSLTFVSDNKDFMKDPIVMELLKHLDINIRKQETEHNTTWQMPCCEVSVSWNCWPERNAFILMIAYHSWNFLFDMVNSFTDIAWGMTKTNIIDDFCITKLRHEINNDRWHTDICQLYATPNKCKNCETPCTLKKIWARMNEPTYKELLMEIPESEYEDKNTLISTRHATICGQYKTVSFILRKNNEQYEILTKGTCMESYFHMQELLSIMDKFAHISSKWYQNFKSIR